MVRRSGGPREMTWRRLPTRRRARVAALVCAAVMVLCTGCPPVPPPAAWTAWDRARPKAFDPDPEPFVAGLLESWGEFPQLDLRGDLGYLQAALFRHLARLRAAPGDPLAHLTAGNPRLAAILKECPTAMDLRFRAARGARSAMLFPGGGIPVDSELALSRDLAIADYLADRLNGDAAVFRRGGGATAPELREPWARLALAEIVADHYARAWDRAEGDPAAASARTAFLGFLGTLKQMWEERSGETALRPEARKAADAREQELAAVLIRAATAHRPGDAGYSPRTDYLEIDPKYHLNRGGAEASLAQNEQLRGHDARAREMLLPALGHYISAFPLHDLAAAADPGDPAPAARADPRASDPLWNTVDSCLETLWNNFHTLFYQGSDSPP